MHRLFLFALSLALPSLGSAQWTNPRWNTAPSNPPSSNRLPSNDAVWAVAPTVHRDDPGALTPQRDERGYARVARLHLAGVFDLPTTNFEPEGGDDQLDYGLGGRLALEVPLFAVVTLGVDAAYTWWRYGEDFLYDQNAARAVSFGAFARLHAIAGVFHAFAGVHGGTTRLDSESGTSWGGYGGPHAGLQFGRGVGFELTVGATWRRFDDVPIPHGDVELVLSCGMYFILQSVQ